MRVLSVTATTFTVTWLAPVASTVNRISNYVLTLVDEFSRTSINITTTSTSHTFAGLQEYRNYSYLVYAASRYGPISVSTASLTATTLEESETVTITE